MTDVDTVALITDCCGGTDATGVDTGAVSTSFCGGAEVIEAGIVQFEHAVVVELM